MQSLQGASAAETPVDMVSDTRPTDAEQTAVMNARDIAAANVLLADEQLVNTGKINPVSLKLPAKAGDAQSSQSRESSQSSQSRELREAEVSLDAANVTHAVVQAVEDAERAEEPAQAAGGDETAGLGESR